MRYKAGFTLMEVIVAIAIVAILTATVAPMVVQQAVRARSRDTLVEMERIFDGMLGNASLGLPGYLGDMGVLPPTLGALVARGAEPLYTVAANGGPPWLFLCGGRRLSSLL